MNLGFGIGGAVAGLIAASARPGTFTTLFLIDAATYGAFSRAARRRPQGLADTRGGRR